MSAERPLEIYFYLLGRFLRADYLHFSLLVWYFYCLTFHKYIIMAFMLKAERSIYVIHSLVGYYYVRVRLLLV